MPSNFNQLPYKYKKFINAEALLEFDAVDDVINLGDFQGILQNGTDFSVEIIFSTSKVTTGTLISKNSLSGSSARGFQISLTGGNALTVVLGGEPSTFAQQISLPTVQRDALYHLVVGVNSGNFFAYLNGRRRVNVAYTGGDYNNTADLVIGKPTDGTTFHEGTIGLCRFYNRALDRDEIIQLSNNPFIAPASVHENSVGEYIPQRSYFKDASNIYGKGANAIIWFDSAEQYNYSKVSPITANHGVMTGWSDAEVVTFPEPTEVKDFYDKTASLDWTNDGGNTEIVSGLPPFKAYNCVGRLRLLDDTYNLRSLVGTNDYTLMITMVNKGAAIFNPIVGFVNDGYFRESTNDISKLGARIDGTDSNVLFFEDAIISDYYIERANGRKKLFQNERLIIDLPNTALDMSLETNFSVLNSDRSGLYLVRVILWVGKTLTKIERIKLFNNGKLSHPESLDMAAYYLMNNDAPFLNGSSPRLKDYSSNNRDILLNPIGADKVAVFLSRIVDLNELV
jgi:hypothetical protein